MGKFTGDSKKLLEYVGGRENIAAVSHCVTRMRFVLNDPSKADTEAIESLSSAKGTFTQAGQFQVIIGNEVSTFYNDFAEVAGIEGVSKDAVKKAAMQNQTLLQRIMSSLAEIFAPLIPAIIVGGLILGFRNIIGEIALFDGGTKTLTQISVFWAGINSFLWLIGEAVFHFLPVCIVWSITKKMGTTQALGIVLGITLVSPQLLNAYSVATTAAAEIPKWNFGLFQVDMIGYQAQVLPAVLAGFTLVYLERFFRKICPAMISMIVVPFCSLLMVGPAHQLALCSDPDIFKLPTPIRREEALSTVSLLLQFGHRMERYTRHRRSPLEQDLIARAKALLMERDGLTEEQAHRTLQKRSMDQGLTLVQTARRTLAQGGG